MKEWIAHYFTPHHTNNHRARVLHIDALFFYAIFFLCTYVISQSLYHNAPEVLGYATDIYVDQLLSSTNTQRQSAGLPPLSLNSQLSQAAAAKAQNMFSNNYWSHTGPNGQTPWNFITASGYKYTVAGENLAKNFSNTQGVVDAWMASPTHRDNILKSQYKDVGFAVVNGVLNGEETTLVVQMFGASQSVIAAKPIAVEVPAQSVEAAELSSEEKKTIPPLVITPTISVKPAIGIASNLPQSPTPIPKMAIAETRAGNNNEYQLGEYNTSQGSTSMGLTLKPFIQMPIFSRWLTLIFGVFMITILALDGYIAHKKKVIRVSGHNIGHIIFIASIVYISLILKAGSII